MDTWVKWLLGVVGVPTIALVATTWADVREMKKYQESMKEARMTTLEMQVKSDKEVADVRMQAMNERIGELMRKAK